MKERRMTDRSQRRRVQQTEKEKEIQYVKGRAPNE